MRVYIRQNFAFFLVSQYNLSFGDISNGGHRLMYNAAEIKFAYCLKDNSYKLYGQFYIQVLNKNDFSKCLFHHTNQSFSGLPINCFLWLDIKKISKIIGTSFIQKLGQFWLCSVCFDTRKPTLSDWFMFTRMFTFTTRALTRVIISRLCRRFRHKEIIECPVWPSVSHLNIRR